MAKAFNPLPMVRDLEIHQTIYVADYDRDRLAQIKALWDERNPAHELVMRGTTGRKFTGMITWREK